MLKFTNNASATLAGSIASTATSITLSSGNGALMPALAAGEFFFATLIDSSNNLEVIRVTARSADVLTVTRAQDGTTARAYAAGDKVELRLVAATFLELVQRDGSVVMTANLNHGGFKATGLAEPTVSTDGATKNYTDTAISSAVSAEATARSNADAAEITARNTAISNEATARTNADTALGAAKVSLDGSNATGTWAGSTEWTRVTNRPTSLNSFSNDPGFTNGGGGYTTARTYGDGVNAMGAAPGGGLNVSGRGLQIIKSGNNYLLWGSNCNCNCCCCC